MVGVEMQGGAYLCLGTFSLYCVPPLRTVALATWWRRRITIQHVFRLSWNRQAILSKDNSFPEIWVDYYNDLHQQSRVTMIHHD